MGARFDRAMLWKIKDKYKSDTMNFGTSKGFKKLLRTGASPSRALVMIHVRMFDFALAETFGKRNVPQAVEEFRLEILQIRQELLPLCTRRCSRQIKKGGFDPERVQSEAAEILGAL